MRAFIGIFLAAAMLMLGGCNTLREAADVQMRLVRPPTPEQINAHLAQTTDNINAMDARLKEMQAKGQQISDAELREMAKQVVSGKPMKDAKAPKQAAPAEQEISVNLVYAGLQPQAGGGKNLDFDFKAFWGDYKDTGKQISVSSKAGRGEARLDLDVAHMRVVPKIVSGTRGKYELELTDRGGSSIGRFNITDSGKQVTQSGKAGKYRTELIYFHPERRLTGYGVYSAGSRKPQMGVIFVGKGWSYVENSKKPDMSKGYIFPEVDMVILPKAWMEENNYEMKETCNTLKKGQTRLGGVCYS